jgi:predicted DNA-binding protein
MCGTVWYMADSVNTSLRVPRELHERLKRAADRNHRSVSNLIVHYVTVGVEQDERQHREQEQKDE